MKPTFKTLLLSSVLVPAAAASASAANVTGTCPDGRNQITVVDQGVNPYFSAFKRYECLINGTSYGWMETPGALTASLCSYACVFVPPVAPTGPAAPPSRYSQSISWDSASFA